MSFDTILVLLRCNLKDYSPDFHYVYRMGEQFLHMVQMGDRFISVIEYDEGKFREEKAH